MKKRLSDSFKKFPKKMRILFVIALLSISTAAVAQTASQYLTNYAWSANTGWIRGGNCTNPNDKTTCDSTATFAYGVTIDPASGKLSGYAWSANIGWITFAPGGCPVTGCTKGASVDLSANGGSGPYPIKGWAQACSVFATGCSGALTSNDARGGWDGYIALDGSWNTPVMLSANKKSITGYAWGSEVVGWVQMNFSVSGSIEPQCSDHNANGTPKDNEDPEDTLANEADPGCHSDGDPTNASSYLPDKNSEVNGSPASITSFGGKCIDDAPYLTWASNKASACYITLGTASVTADDETSPNSKDVSGSVLSAGAYYVLQSVGSNKNPSFMLTCVGQWGTDNGNAVVSGPVSIDLQNCTDGTDDGGGDGGGDGGDPNPKPKRCSDGIDNDHDGYIDWNGGTDENGKHVDKDPGCSGPNDDNEFNAIIDEH
jgi:hypothetical protein